MGPTRWSSQCTRRVRVVSDCRWQPKALRCRAFQRFCRGRGGPGPLRAACCAVQYGTARNAVRRPRRRLSCGLTGCLTAQDKNGPRRVHVWPPHGCRIPHRDRQRTRSGEGGHGAARSRRSAVLLTDVLVRGWIHAPARRAPPSPSAPPSRSGCCRSAARWPVVPWCRWAGVRWSGPGRCARR